jgi:hypothetical protein
MEQFLDGVMVGLLIVATVAIAFLTFKNKKIEAKFAETSINDDDIKITEKIDGLTNDELDALIDKNLGTGPNGTSGTSSGDSR